MARAAWFQRFQALDNRALWQLLAALLAVYLLVLNLLTQSADEAINLLLLIGGAMLVFPGFPEGWQPRPGRLGRWLGLAVLLAMFWRGQRMVAFDFGSSLLLPMAGLGLVWLAAPVGKWRPFAWPLAVLSLLPLWRAVGWLMPLGPLSELTAWLSRQWLELCGFSAQQQGLYVYLPGGGVKVAAACAGLNILLQLVVVALLFAKAFPMRRRWQNTLMILVAPVVAVLMNAMRVALLAWINASGWPQKQWWFDFLHDSWGGLVFAGVAMQLFVWLYVYWLARQVAALGSR
ncbi:MAG: exosortase/archaeosortase family protein [Cyanobium sp.]